MTVNFNLVAAGGAGEASNIVVAAFPSGAPEFITAMKNGSGNLELIGWTVRDNTLTRAGTALGPAVQRSADNRGTAGCHGGARWERKPISYFLGLFASTGKHSKSRR
jgi:hypothetical protein